ncbi:MAG: DNA repair protein RecO [Proteobacteria bacterium]|nr:DNA repair protein RecO [Pseudomonadota bacterium]
MSYYTETSGYVIHQRNYRDSSLLIEFFSRDYGKIQLIAKGIKKNKLLKPQLQYFNLLKIQYFGRSQLKTLSSVNIINQFSNGGILEKTAGLYLNELVHYSLAEKSDRLFECYQVVLSKLGKEKLTPLLRMFERELLKYCGFEISIDSFAHVDSWLCVDEVKGLIETKVNSQKICTVEELSLFIENKKLNHVSQKRINDLMRKMVDLSVNFRRIYSRELLISLTRN